MIVKSKPALLPLKDPRDVQGLFWRPNEEFIQDLASNLQGKKVLEIFAGNGFLAAHLAKRGIDIISTSLLSSMDAHEKGIYHPIIEKDAVAAVKDHGSDRDVLLMCWPTTTPQAFKAAHLWGNRPIYYIGEFTDYEKGQLGGCATDEFHACFQIDKELPSYQGNDMEKACFGKLGEPSMKFLKAMAAFDHKNRIYQDSLYLKNNTYER